MSARFQGTMYITFGNSLLPVICVVSKVIWSRALDFCPTGCLAGAARLVTGDAGAATAGAAGAGAAAAGAASAGVGARLEVFTAGSISSARLTIATPSSNMVHMPFTVYLR